MSALGDTVDLFTIAGDLARRSGVTAVKATAAVAGVWCVGATVFGLACATFPLDENGLVAVVLVAFAILLLAVIPTTAVTPLVVFALSALNETVTVHAAVRSAVVRAPRLAEGYFIVACLVGFFGAPVAFLVGQVAPPLAILPLLATEVFYARFLLLEHALAVVDGWSPGPPLRADAISGGLGLPLFVAAILPQLVLASAIPTAFGHDVLVQLVGVGRAAWMRVVIVVVAFAAASFLHGLLVAAAFALAIRPPSREESPS